MEFGAVMHGNLFMHVQAERRAGQAKVLGGAQVGEARPRLSFSLLVNALVVRS